MTLDEFIKYELKAKFGEDFMDKEIKYAAPNGLHITPKVKKVVNQEDPFNGSPENTEYLVITWD